MSTAVAKANGNGHLDPAIIESLVIGGDLSGLNNTQRVQYYKYRCEQVGLDPSAKPFDVLKLQGKTVLYANAGCTQQLCQLHSLSPIVKEKTVIDGVFVVTSQVTGGGRTTENIGAVPIGGLKGNDLANAMMKAITKAHRRTILMHCGLGMLDETEVETIPNAQPQGRGNPLRKEFMAWSYELDACKSQEQGEALFASPEYLDFKARDAQQSSGMSFCGMMEDRWEQMKKKLPERIEDKRTYVKTIDEYPNGSHPADVAPAPETITQGTASEISESGSNSLPAQEPSVYSPIVQDYFDQIDMAESEDELTGISIAIANKKDAINGEDMNALRKAWKQRQRTVTAKADA